VGQLTGFPFPAGGASVWRVAPGGEPEVYASGLTNIIDLAFGPDGTLWVLEFTHNGLMSGDPNGALLTVPAGGGEPTLVTDEGLMAPGAVAVGSDGTVYVTIGSLAPGGGSIVTLNQ
jgi:glucose/arabinose dehydrogenase